MIKLIEYGFSKMLQLVDDSIMRNTNNDNINNNLLTNTNTNTEDYNTNLKTIFNVNYTSKLPKMKSKYINTARNINVNLEGSLSSRNKNKNENLSIHIDEQNNSKRPQIMKIYKINKNSENKYNNSSSSSSNIHRSILVNSQNKNVSGVNNSETNNIKTYSQLK